MLPRNQVLSIIAFSSFILLAILFHPEALQHDFTQTQHPITQTHFSNLQNEYHNVPGDKGLEGYSNTIAIEFGETSRAGFLENGKFITFVNDQGRNFTPSCVNGSCIRRPNFNEAIAFDIFKKLKTDAEGYFGQDVMYAVVGAPAYFNDTQRQLIKDAGALAGLTILRIVNEPIAAAIGYKADQENREMDIIVYNLNSNSVDVTIQTVDRGVFEMLAQATGTVGSEDFEEAVLDLMADTPEIGPQVSDAQEILSNKIATKTQHTITQTQIDDAYKKVFDKTIPLIDRVVKESQLEKSKLSRIILTGDPQHIAKIQPFIEQYLGKKVYEGISSDEVILQGLAQQAYVLSNIDDVTCTLYLDATLLSLGIDVDGITTKVVHRNTIIPTMKSITITTTEDNQPSINLTILEGDRSISSKNEQLGTMEILVSPAPAGIPQIVVLFEVDADGLLKVMNWDKAQGESWETATSLVMETAFFKPSWEKIDDSIEGAEINDEADQVAKEAIEKDNFKPSFRVVEESRSGYENGAVINQSGWFNWLWY